MVSRPFDCDPNRLRRLLDDRLDDPDQSAMAEHLGTCDDCRRTLDALAAGSKWWSDARVFLGTPPTCDLGETPHSRKAEVEPGLLDFLASSDDPAHLGRLGPYEVVEVIGRGGMGLVLRAIDPALNRHVAIKVLAPELATSATARRRFAREGQAAAAISHDHIVAIYGVDGSGPLPYLVMQLVTGKSLQERIDQTGPLAVEEILRIGMQTASGLAAAHAVGLIHRDVKPSNILLENCVERVKITDFGLARAVDDASLTQSGVVAGTPQYMSPEQARGEAADHRADLFSLGSVLYALCTGRPPFRAETTMAVLRRVSDDTPRPIRELNAEIPIWLAAIIDRLHAKNPADRFASATEVAELLGRCIAYLREPTLMAPPFEIESAVAPKPRRRRFAMAAGVAVLAFCALGASEVTGVTKFVATVLRFKTADGTLVVKVSDPKVKVRLDGKDLVISGAGPEEIRVNAGQHHVQGLKDGKVVSETIVSIARGGEETVDVSVEPSPAPATATTPAPKEGAAEIEIAEIDRKRASNRLDWAKMMLEKGYVSRGQFDADHNAFLKAQLEAANVRRKHQEEQLAKSADLQRAKADLNLANAVEARNKRLAEKGVLSREELSEADLVKRRAGIVVEQKAAALGEKSAAIARENADLKRRIDELQARIEGTGHGISVPVRTDLNPHQLALRMKDVATRIASVRHTFETMEARGRGERDQRGVEAEAEQVLRSTAEIEKVLPSLVSDVKEIADASARVWLQLQLNHIFPEFREHHRHLQHWLSRAANVAEAKPGLSLADALSSGLGTKSDPRSYNGASLHQDLARLLRATKSSSDSALVKAANALIQVEDMRIGLNAAASADRENFDRTTAYLETSLSELKGYPAALRDAAMKKERDRFKLQLFPYLGSTYSFEHGLTLATKLARAESVEEYRNAYLIRINKLADRFDEVHLDLQQFVSSGLTVAERNPGISVVDALMQGVSAPSARPTKFAFLIDDITRLMGLSNTAEIYDHLKGLRTAEIERSDQIQSDQKSSLLDAPRSRDLGADSELPKRETNDLKRRVRELEEANRRLEDVARERGETRPPDVAAHDERSDANIVIGDAFRFRAGVRVRPASPSPMIDTRLPSLRTDIRPAPTPSGSPVPHPDARPAPMPAPAPIAPLAPLAPAAPSAVLAPLDAAPAPIAPLAPVPPRAPNDVPEPKEHPDAPPSAVPSEAEEATEVGTAVFQVVIAPDGKTFATACDDGVIRIYDLATRKVVRELKQSQSRMTMVLESKDDQDIIRPVISTTNGSRLWAIAYRPDGKTLVAAGGSFDDHEHPAAITVWDVATGKVKTKLVGHEMTILALAISPDGQRLVSGGFERTVRIWDLDANKMIKSFDAHVDQDNGVASPVRSIAWNPDGKSFAALV